MDHIDGETLQERLVKMPYGMFLARKALPVALQLCAALDYLHSHQPPVIFRAMKPANAMISGQDHLYLIDFGIVRFFKPGQGNGTVASGSVGYAAPEHMAELRAVLQALSMDWE
jgi:serine/threonine protein kinase